MAGVIISNNRTKSHYHSLLPIELFQFLKQFGVIIDVKCNEISLFNSLILQSNTILSSMEVKNGGNYGFCKR